MHPRCCGPATSWVHYSRSCNSQSSAPEDGQNNCAKHVELTGIINKSLLLHIVGCLYYLYQLCTVKQISENEIYLLIKYIKSVLWRAVKRLSSIEDARCLKVNWYSFYSVLYSNESRKGVGGGRCLSLKKWPACILTAIFRPCNEPRLQIVVFLSSAFLCLYLSRCRTGDRRTSLCFICGWSQLVISTCSLAINNHAVV